MDPLVHQKFVRGAMHQGSVNIALADTSYYYMPIAPAPKLMTPELR